MYGLAAVDCQGRVADQVIMAALGGHQGLAWTSGNRLLVVRADPCGVFTMTKQGHLPATARHRCGLRAGDRVLLVAEPARDVLLVHPPAVLDDLLVPRLAELLDGDRT